MQSYSRHADPRRWSGGRPARLLQAVLLQALLQVLLVWPASASPAAAPAPAPLHVGSKRFTESYILGEIVTQAAMRAGETRAVHERGIGNTAILVNALTSGSIDVYPEYTGTIAREILKLPEVPPISELNRRLAALGLAIGVPLGFNNTYALAVRASDARARHIARISDLAQPAPQFPALRLGLSPEFIGRADGWPGLVRRYCLRFAAPRGLDHGLAYEAIGAGQVDLIDIYSTDAKIERYNLVVLDDDRHAFPRYEAVLLYRAELPDRLPATWAALGALQGQIDESAMRRLNASAELDGVEFAAIAAGWLAAHPPAGAPDSPATPAASAAPRSAVVAAVDSGTASVAARSTLWQRIFAADFGRLAAEQLTLVFGSLAASCLIAVPLGVIAARRPRWASTVFAVTGVIQTIPALALLAFLISLSGRIGTLPAFIALTLYALLPIVRNTHTGLTQIPRGLREAAAALGLRPHVVLRRIELPLALPTLLAGIKTSAIINVGTATIAAFVGAGGFGERIVTGLALNDQLTMLAGAIPVAVLALVLQAGFDVLELRLIPPGSRPRP